MRIPFFSWVFLMPICIVLLSLCIFGVSGQCLDSERSSLLRLKNELKFDPAKSKKLGRWNGSADCCLWEGVTCQWGRVIGLDLSSETISDGLNSSSLFGLQYLQNLSLGFNKFSDSQIPSEFEKLKNLVCLNLSNAGFVGQIPMAISRLTRLVVLDLSVIYFPDAPSLELENPNLNGLVQNLSELIELYLDGMNISANGKEWCQILSSSLQKLTVLSLSNCYLSGPIDASLLMLKSLSIIRLDNNNLSTPVPGFLANFTNLISLRLSFAGLRGTFPQKIFNISTLEILDLSNNKLLQGSLPEFPRNGALRNLVLSSTNFSGTLPHSMGNLKMLSTIDLSSCNFQGSIPKSMENLSQLVYLDLSQNRFKGPIPSFSFAKNLTQINLSHNDLSGPINSTDWQELSHLFSVDLSYNSLNGRIPYRLFSQPSLQRLQLSNNQFSGQVKNISKISSFQLNILDLSSNNLEGPMPRFVSEIQGLKTLSLSYNNFSGSLQLEWIQKLQNLTSLDLSYNSWIGYNGPTLSASSFPQLTTIKLASCDLRKFPDFLRNQSRLNYLDLSCNQINGSIPSWMSKFSNLLHLNLSFNYLTTMEGHLSNLSSLSVLDLHSNHLEGKLPILPLVTTILDLSENNLQSPLPPNIGNSLGFAYFFSLSSNKFYGQIPKSICNASYLQALDLSNNSFHGSIPTCLIEMSRTLGVLNLRRNNLSNSIPNSFSNNCSLQTLDLYGNQLRGKLPRSLANCRDLEVFNIGNNQIEDIFPCYLRNASMLRVLVLRSNKFYGQIGCSVPNVTWPMLQIVDGASNEFTGELPKILSWKAMMSDENITHLQFEVLQFGPPYYQDSVTITSKGRNIELVKILTIFTSIDLSLNNLNGSIPKEMGEFRLLHILNLSHNGFTGHIPSSLGKLSSLESLDLSSNNLTGEIPLQLADGLIFLSVLDLSFNQLVGKIPSAKQFATFSNNSFEGNSGLCGPPLTVKCKDNALQPTSHKKAPTMPVGFDWEFILIGLGFGTGAALVVGPLMFWEKGRRCYDARIDKILLVVLPMMGLSYTGCGNAKVEAEDDIEDENAEDDDDDEDEAEDEEFRGRYCVFCSKLDISRKRAIHDLHCTCYNSPPLSSSSSTSSSSS